MRLVKGVKALSEYLKTINCGISESTIYRLVKQDMIPYKRPAPGIIVFDLDAIDSWLTYEDINHI